MVLSSAVESGKSPVSTGALLLAFGVGIPGIAFRLMHLGDFPLSPIDEIAMGLGIGLFVASVLDFWNERVRRGLAISVLRLALTGCVALHVDVPIAVPTLLKTYAEHNMNAAISSQDKVRASLTVLAVIDHSQLLSLVTMSPQQIVDDRFCGVYVSEYERHVARALPAIVPYFARGLRACRLFARRGSTSRRPSISR